MQCVQVVINDLGIVQYVPVYEHEDESTLLTICKGDYDA